MVTLGTYYCQTGIVWQLNQINIKTFFEKNYLNIGYMKNFMYGTFSVINNSRLIN